MNDFYVTLAPSIQKICFKVLKVFNTWNFETNFLNAWNFKTNFLKNENLFQKTEVTFFSWKFWQIW